MTIIPASTFAQSSRLSGGRAARASGRSLEQVVLASQNDERGPVVRIVQIANAGRVIKTPRGLQMIREKSVFDFAGVVCATAQCIAFDAKRCGSDSASLRVNAAEILKPHQIASLRMLEDAGAVAGILCESCRIGRYLWLAARHLSRDKPVRWDDEAWIDLGPNSGIVKFRRLLEA